MPQPAHILAVNAAITCVLETRLLLFFHTLIASIAPMTWKGLPRWQQHMRRGLYRSHRPARNPERLQSPPCWSTDERVPLRVCLGFRLCSILCSAPASCLLVRACVDTEVEVVTFFLFIRLLYLCIRKATYPALRFRSCASRCTYTRVAALIYMFHCVCVCMCIMCFVSMYNLHMCHTCMAFVWHAQLWTGTAAQSVQPRKAAREPRCPTALTFMVYVWLYL